MANLVNLDAEAGANIVGDDAAASLTLDNTSTGEALKVKRTNANATVPSLVVEGVRSSSAASAPAFAVNIGGFASITSVVLTTVANTDYAIRVWINGEPRWIPCFKDAGVIGAAAAA